MSPDSNSPTDVIPATCGSNQWLLGSARKKPEGVASAGCPAPPNHPSSPGPRIIVNELVITDSYPKLELFSMIIMFHPQI